MSTRFNTVHPGRAPLPGPPRFTTVVFDMSKTTGKTPGSSRSIRHHPGPSRWTTVQPPVGLLPGSPRSMDRGEPGSTGSPVGLGHYSRPNLGDNHAPRDFFKLFDSELNVAMIVINRMELTHNLCYFQRIIYENI